MEFSVWFANDKFNCGDLVSECESTPDNINVCIIMMLGGILLIHVVVVLVWLQGQMGIFFM